MFVIRLLWRLLRRRWLRRLLFWLAVRVIKLFGWRRAGRLVLRGRGRWRLLALGAWRGAVRLLRLGRAALLVIGWAARASQRLSSGKRAAPFAAHLPTRGRARAGHRRGRLARRRDELWRAALTTFGLDPEWRPRSGRKLGGARAQLGE